MIEKLEKHYDMKILELESLDQLLNLV